MNKAASDQPPAPRAWAPSARASSCGPGAWTPPCAARAGASCSTRRTARTSQLPSLEIHPYGGGAGTLELHIGRDAMLGRGLILEVWAAADNVVELGDRATFRAGVRVQMRGGAVRLGNDARIRDYSLLEASGGEIVLGDSVQFGAQVCLHATERIALGDHVTVGERTSMFDSDHRHDGSDAPVVDQPVAVTPIEIASNTFIGANSLILRGAAVGPNCMFAGASVVRGGEYPGGFLYAGSPPRPSAPCAATTRRPPRLSRATVHRLWA